MSIRKFEDIEAWQSAREMALEVGRIISEGEFARSFSLKDQIDRASGSAMDNIAEGFNGGSTPEFIRFLSYSQRSCLEVQSQLYRALDRKLITQEQFHHLYELAARTHAKTGGFIKYLKSHQKALA